MPWALWQVEAPAGRVLPSRSATLLSVSHHGGAEGPVRSSFRNSLLFWKCQGPREQEGCGCGPRLRTMLTVTPTAGCAAAGRRRAARPPVQPMSWPPLPAWGMPYLVGLVRLTAPPVPGLWAGELGHGGDATLGHCGGPILGSREGFPGRAASAQHSSALTASSFDVLRSVVFFYIKSPLRVEEAGLQELIPTTWWPHRSGREVGGRGGAAGPGCLSRPVSRSWGWAVGLPWDAGLGIPGELCYLPPTPAQGTDGEEAEAPEERQRRRAYERGCQRLRKRIEGGPCLGTGCLCAQGTQWQAGRGAPILACTRARPR